MAQVLLDAGANTEAKDKVRGGWEGKGGEIRSGAVRCTHWVVFSFRGCFVWGRKIRELTMLVSRFMSADFSSKLGLRRPFLDLEVKPFDRSRPKSWNWNYFGHKCNGAALSRCPIRDLIASSTQARRAWVLIASRFEPHLPGGGGAVLFVTCRGVSPTSIFSVKRIFL